MSRFAIPSHIRSLILLSALLAAAAVSQDGHAPARATPAGPSYLFLSPNTDDNLSMAEVARRLTSPSQKRYRNLAGDILLQLGIAGAEVHDAVGDWGGVVENSLLVVLPSADPQTLRCAAAWFGLLAHQKAVLAFHPDPAGPDELMILELPAHDRDAARQLLDSHGVRDRTLLAQTRGCRVVVLAVGPPADALRRAVRHVGGRLRSCTGWGEYLAAPTRRQAGQQYTEVIRAYRAMRVLRPVARVP